jgi:hypothetical protein
VLIDGMLPVQVPVEAAGSPTLVDDPVLHAGSEGEPRVGAVLCPATGPADAGGTKKTVIRLPSDVLFAFGSADLTAAAQQALAAVDDEIGSGGTGTVPRGRHLERRCGDRRVRGDGPDRGAELNRADVPA